MRDRAASPLPSRILMSVDAVGGVWRYAMDLAAGLSRQGVEIVFACFGPPASPEQVTEARAIGIYVAVDAPLDWMVSSPSDLKGVTAALERLARRHKVDLLHLNLPSQAAALDVKVPVLVVSHSCVVTWFRTMRGAAPPADWLWQRDLNAQGLAAAAAVVAPSSSHADNLSACYGALRHLHVVHNGSAPADAAGAKEPFVMAAARWWDEGKNGAVLDRAARTARWPVLMAGSVQGPNGQYQPIAHAQRLGEVSHAEVRRFMARAAVFASPSIYEPFGLAALEAAHSGAALVLADIPTYRELWEGAALFAEPDDPDAFRAAIDALAEDVELREDLGRKARGRASRCSLEAQLQGMTEVYAGLLRRPVQLRASA